MLRQDFRKGDIVVVTSQRNPQRNGIASDMCFIYERDVNLDEAAIYKQKYEEKYFNISVEEWKEVLKNYDRYFLTSDGNVLTYENHELADIFDKRYLIDKEDIDKLIIEKDEYINKHNITADSDGHFRCF